MQLLEDIHDQVPFTGLNNFIKIYKNIYNKDQNREIRKVNILYRNIQQVLLKLKNYKKNNRS